MQYLCKDVLGIILKKLSDEDIVSIIKTCKDLYFYIGSIDSFWYNKITEKHGPKCINFKSEGRTYQNFYFSLKKYPDKSKIFDNICYSIQNEDLDIIKYFISMGRNRHIDFLHTQLYWAATTANKEIIDFFVNLSEKELGYNEYCELLSGSITGGHEKNIQLYMNAIQDYEVCANVEDTILDIAAKKGRMDLIYILLDRRESCYNEIAVKNIVLGAMSGGHFEIFKKYFTKVYSDYDIFAAAGGGNMDILNIIIEKSKKYSDWKEKGLCGAAEAGNLDIIKLFLSLGAKNIKKALVYANYNRKNKAVIEYLKSQKI